MSQTAEVIPFAKNEIKPFSEFESQLAKLKDDNSKAVFDYSSPKGNKEARSHIFTLRQTKGALEKARKAAKEDALNYGRLIDTEAKRINGELETMIEVHDKPLREIEEHEAARVEAIKTRIASMENYKSYAPDASAEQWADELKSVEAFVLDDSLAEFKASAAIAKDIAIGEIKSRLTARQKYEAEQAELEQLRKQAAEQARKEHEEKIASEAAAKATREAEEKAEQERVAAARKEADAERQRQEEANKQAVALETAKRQKAEAEERAAKAEQTAKENAERELLAKKQAEEDAAKKREENKKHQAKINNEAVADLVKAGLTPDMAKLAVISIAKHEVAHVAIRY